MEDANKTPRGGSGGLITATGPEEGLVVQGLCSQSFPTDFLESLGWDINSVRVYLGKRASPASPWTWVEEEEGENHLLGIPLPLRVHELVCTEPKGNFRTSAEASPELRNKQKASVPSDKVLITGSKNMLILCKGSKDKV